MNINYTFAIILALVVVIGGVFLLGRDGTNNEADVAETSQENLVEESLPVDENASTTEESSEEPILEEGDAEASADKDEVSELPDENTEEEAAPEENVEETEDETVAEEETVDAKIITYTDSGFSPKTTSVADGDKVTFINNSSNGMWVASAFHPTHTQYAEESDDDCLGSSFDACTGIPEGQSWSFTFTSIGEWDYHDHLNPSRSGTVVVE